MKAVMADHEKLASGLECERAKVGQWMASLERHLDIGPKLSRLKYTGVRLINSEEYRDADEKRTRAGANERVEDLAREYFPDVPDDILDKVLLKEVRQYLDVALEKRFPPKKPAHLR